MTGTGRKLEVYFNSVTILEEPWLLPREEAILAKLQPAILNIPSASELHSEFDKMQIPKLLFQKS